MARSVVSALLEELVKHQKHAAKAQAVAVRRIAQAKQSRTGGGAGASGVSGGNEEYVPPPLNTAAAQRFRLEELREADAIEVIAYLKHQRQYKELLDKYASGPQDTLSHVQATARRVGLDASKL